MARSATSILPTARSLCTLLFGLCAALSLTGFEARASDARLAGALAQVECTPARIRPLQLGNDLQAYRVDCTGSPRAVVVVCQQHTCSASPQRQVSDDEDSE
jgi:hypothetical protein